jgi:hypothetical protein
MSFLAKCIKKFDLKNDELKNFISKAFISTVKSHNEIRLDTSFINPSRVDMLFKVLMVITL